MWTYLFGLARNERLVEAIKAELMPRPRESNRTGRPARRFKDFPWSTLDSWSRSRRVVGKAEVDQGRANPRFVVTSLKAAEIGGRYLYEKSIALAARWRTASRSVSSICSPIALRRRPCAPTNCGCGSLHWPMCCSAPAPHRAGAHAVCRCHLRHHPAQAAEARRAGARSAYGGSRSRWPPPAPIRTSSPSHHPRSANGAA